MLTPFLRGVVTPPPVMPVSPTVSSASGITSQALQQGLYYSIPHSTAAQSSARMKLTVLHPTMSYMAYMLDLIESKTSPQRQIVVQDYITGTIIYQISMGDLCALMFDLDKASPTYTTKLAAGFRSIGKVERLDFHDPSTLFATGMPSGTVSFSHLIVQLSSKIVLLNLKRGPNSLALEASLRQQVNPNSRQPFYQPIIAQIGDSALKESPTTIAVPLSPSLLLIGCSDGSSELTLRFTSISNKAHAYLWEFEIDNDGIPDIRPVQRMDGHFTSASSLAEAKSGNSLSPTLSGSISSAAAAAAAANANADNYWDHTLVDFDAHRELLMWFIPSGYKNSSRSHVLVWDLTLTNRSKKKKSSSPPKEDPCIISFTSLDTTTFTLVAGWLHPDFSANVFLCALVAQTGDLFLQVVNLDADGYPGASVKAAPWFTCSLSAMIQKEVGCAGPPVMRVSKVLTHRRLDTTSLLLSTNMGVVQVALADDMIGSRHVHLPAHVFGSELGKAVLSVKQSDVQWQPIDIDANGEVVVKVNERQIVYQSPLPADGPVPKRTVRLPPRFYTSPSGKFVSLYWPDEKRYEILHIASSLNKRSPDSYAPAVAKGTDVLDIAWVGDDDAFALLLPPLESRDDGSLPSSGASDGPLSSSMSVGSAAVKTFRKNFKIGRDKTDRTVASQFSTMSMDDGNFSTKNSASRFLPRVELHILVGVTANAAELGSIAAATARSIGEITLRGGNRLVPTDLFSGPNLCVASKDNGPDGGAAHFYTLKPGVAEMAASNFVQAGPTLPCPDFVQWDDEGILCALVVQGLVAIYLSRDSEFVLLGNVELGAPREKNVTVTGLKFVHGVLYCTTRTTVQCVVLGDLSTDCICNLDTFILASADGPTIGPKWTITPPTTPMTLNHPAVLGYQSGSLLVSTVTGLLAIRMDHPLLRISTLLAAGQTARAQRWFDAIPETDHEALAYFLDRRGAADLAVAQLTGLSLETMVDLSLRYGLTDKLEELILTYGVVGFHGIDMGRGVSVGILGPEEHGHSLVVSVGAYLLSQGRLELVQHLARECLALKNEVGTTEAFMLASLLLAVDTAEPRKILQASVGEKQEPLADNVAFQVEPAFSNDYALPTLVRDFIL
ncbi:hypothetical protein MHU86_22634 [Fragilaria crotonensis]|nr:hypothetical protein MHU86_22634 [Fragilaria crotonensis]